MLQLHPFQQDSVLKGIVLEGHLRWVTNQLLLHFRLEAPLKQLVCPSQSATPQRLDDLWHSTCLEAFFAVPGEPHYWEFNLSPSGDWNLYRLEDYRQGLREEPGVGIGAIRLKKEVVGSAVQLEAEVALDLGETLSGVTMLEGSLSAVIEQQGRGCSFWALEHCGEEADFHRRESFILGIKKEDRSA